MAKIVAPAARPASCTDIDDSILRARRAVHTDSPIVPDTSFEVELPGPIDVPASVEIFRRNGDDGIDRWDGVHLVRTIRVDGRLVAYACTPA